MVPEINWHFPPAVCELMVSTTDVWFDRPFQLPTMLAGQYGVAAEAPEAAAHPASIAHTAIFRWKNIMISILSLERRFRRRPTDWVRNGV
jgi:hypothetical protein